MKTKLLAIIAFCVSASAMAQVSEWTLRDVPDQTGTIYRQEVIGISTRDSVTKRSRTAISLVCTQVPRSAKIFIQWENIQGYGDRKVNYTVDSRSTPNGSPFVMKQENDILYRDLESSRELLQAMKTGSILTVDWVGFDQTRYLTAFNLSTFRSNLSEFNKRCNTDF